MNNAVRAILVLAMCGTLSAQWLSYPTAGVPHTSDGKPNLSAPAPRTQDGKPDLSGLWNTDQVEVSNAFLGTFPFNPQFVDIATGMPGGLPYQPWAAELVKARQAENTKNDPDARCMPLGAFKMHLHPGPRKMLQLPGLIVILFERDTIFRQIFTDGRPLPADPQPSFHGYSIGKWDGDTLVVTTNGFRDGLWIDIKGDPLTEAAKMTERFHRVNFGKLEIEVTVNDPKAYTKPWTVKLNQHIDLDTDVLEFFCNENNKDVEHLVGK
jgi:hypothetical protein